MSYGNQLKEVDNLIGVLKRLAGSYIALRLRGE